MINLIIVLMLIPSIAALSLLIPAVQKAAVTLALDYASEVLETPISIEGIYLRPFRTLQVEGVLIKDHHQDTLLYARSLDLKLQAIDLTKNHFELGLSKLSSAYFNHVIYKGDSISNLQRLLNQFESEDSKASKPVIVVCEELDLDGVKFENHDWNESYEAGGRIDYKHLVVNDIYAEISSLSFNDSITGRVERLFASESSGLMIRYLDASVKVKDQNISLKDIKLVTNRSVVFGDFEMNFDTYSDFNQFEKRVQLSTQLSEVCLDFRDIGFFAPQVSPWFTRLAFQGKAKGTISNLSIESDSLGFGADSRMRGKVRIKGLPSTDDLLFQANIRELYITPSDFQELGLPVDGGVQHVMLPETFSTLQYLQFDGSLNGFLNDFVLFGRVGTNFGTIAADLNLKNQKGDLQYSGTVASNEFDFRSFIAQEWIGTAGFNLVVQGHGTNKEDLDIELLGALEKADLYGYRYDKVQLTSRWHQDVLEVKVDVRDPNLLAEVQGKMDLSETLNHFESKAKIRRANLDKINLPLDSATSFRADVVLDFRGNRIKDLNGSLSLRNIEYAAGSDQLNLDSLVFEEELIKGKRRVSIQTDVGGFEVLGQTSLIDLPYAFQQVGAHFAPDLFSFSVPDTTNKFQVFDFNLTLDNEKSFIHFLNPKLKLSDQLRVSGRLSMLDTSFLLTSDSIDWTFDELKVANTSIDVHPHGDSLLAIIDIDRMEFSDGYFLENMNLDASLFNDSLLTVLQWKNMSDQADSGRITLISYNSDEYTYNSVLQGLNLRIANVKWYATQSASLSLDSAHLAVSGLELLSKNGAIKCDGAVSLGKDDHLLLEVEHLDLSYLSNFGIVQNEIEGVLNANVDLFQSKGSLSANASIEADSLIIDGLEVGRIEGGSVYDHDAKNLDIDVDLIYKGERNIKLYGDFYPERKVDQIDMRLKVDKFRVALLEPFLEKQLSEMSGQINGTVDLTGTTSQMFLDGELSLTDFVGKVGYLKTKYTLPKGDIIFEKDFIGMDAVRVLDGKGSEGFMTATVFHENFRNFNYDVYVNANNFTALNTTSSDNSAYYGTANITGDVSISGYRGEMDIEVIAKTNKKTKLSIPIDDGGDVSELDYIRFVRPKSVVTESNSQFETLESELSGLSLNFQLEVTDDAELQIIFDEKIGDVVKVKGVGDILMEIDNRGTFAMYGAYQISQGDYLFTLQNVINKRFDVRPGSRIVWNGSPYDAQVNLTAIYGLKASPAPIAASVGDTSQVYRRRMPVDVYLNMNGPLLEPLITFDIDLPSLPESDIVNQLLDPVVTSEQDMNEQVFALLLAGTFFNSQDGIAGFKTGQRTTYEMVSNQFSNWLSQYFDNVDIGVNYRPGDEGQQLGNQTEVEISTELFNERVLVEVNGSVQGQDGSSTDERNVAGEFNIEYKINEEGTFRARVFNEANNYNPVNLNQSPYTQGVGLFYRKEFGRFGDLFRKKNKDK